MKLFGIKFFEKRKPVVEIKPEPPKVLDQPRLYTAEDLTAEEKEIYESLCHSFQRGSANPRFIRFGSLALDTHTGEYLTPDTLVHRLVEIVKNRK